MGLEFGLQKREELNEAGAIMARAYENYDYVTLYFPDTVGSRKGLQIFMNCVVKTNFGRADMLAAHRDGKMVARATLEPPGFKRPSAFQYIVHGFLRVYLNTKWSRINGFLAMDEAACKPCHDYQKSGAQGSLSFSQTHKRISPGTRSAATRSFTNVKSNTRAKRSVAGA